MHTGLNLFYHIITQKSNPEIVTQVYSFSVFNNDRITLDVGPGVIEFTLINEGDNNEIVFNNTQPDLIRVSLVSINAGQTILSSFRNLPLADLNDVRMDGFPLFFSNLEEMRLNSLMLPSVVTIQIANFNLTRLTNLDLHQTADEE